MPSIYKFILFRYYETIPKNKPKFQYWLAGTEDEISNWSNYENKDKLELDKSDYTKTYTIAKAIIETADVDLVKNKMAKSFKEFSIKHSETIVIEDITNYQNTQFPYFTGKVNI